MPRPVAIVLLILAGVFAVTVALFSALLIISYGYADYGFGVIFLIVGWALALGMLVVAVMRLWRRLPRR